MQGIALLITAATIRSPIYHNLWTCHVTDSGLCIFLTQIVIWSYSVAVLSQLYSAWIQGTELHTQHDCSSIPSTDWQFLPNLDAAQLWNSPSLLSKNYSWLLPQQQISGSYSIEAENLRSLNAMPVHRQFTFHPRTQCDWINTGGHTYKNTTH